MREASAEPAMIQRRTLVVGNVLVDSARVPFERDQSNTLSIPC